MSLLGKIKDIGKKVVGYAAQPILTAVGGAYGGPAGASIGSSIGAGLSSSYVAGASTAGMSSLPQLGRVIGGGAVVAGGMVARGARAVYYTASYYCRKYPAWCAQIGGIAAVSALVDNGTLPTIKRRRRRGITPRDLQSFRRVAGLIKTYGPTARRVPTRCAPRRKSC